MHGIPPIHKLNHHQKKYIYSINKNMKLTIKINFKENVFAIMPVMGHGQQARCLYNEFILGETHFVSLCSMQYQQNNPDNL